MERGLGPRVALALLFLSACQARDNAPLPSGKEVLSGFLETPGGPLRFGLILEDKRAIIKNGHEQILAPATRTGDEVTIAFPHYDSTLVLKRDEQNNYTGRFERARYKGDPPKRESRVLRAYTRPLKADRFPVDMQLHGRWTANFAKSGPGVFVVEQRMGAAHQGQSGSLFATVMTETGDYRYLHGQVKGREARLSTFDGSHAFLFTIKKAGEGKLRGDFYSGDHWHETFTMSREAGAALKDPGALSAFNAEQKEALFSMPLKDLAGKNTTLSSSRGKPMVVEIFGSWCPNCHDAAPVLSAIAKQHKDLAVVGLAFEQSGDETRDLEQIKRYVARHKIEHPVFLAGVSSKKKASATLAFLDELKAYPTFVFLSAAGEAVYVHTGFSGPATPDFEKTRAALEDGANKALSARASP